MEKDTYITVNNNPKKLLMDWFLLFHIGKKNKFIVDIMYNKIYWGDGLLPKAYELPKIHKSINPLRIIIFSVNGPLYSLSALWRTLSILAYQNQLQQVISRILIILLANWVVAFLILGIF